MNISQVTGPATEALEASRRKRCFTKFSNDESVTQRFRELKLHTPVLSFPSIEWSIDEEESISDLTVSDMQLLGDATTAADEATHPAQYTAGRVNFHTTPQSPEGKVSRMLRSRSFTSSLSLLDYTKEYKQCTRASAA